MSVEVKLSEVVEAMDTVTEGVVYYLDKRTGEIILLTNEVIEAAEEDEVISDYPDWQREMILKAYEVLQNPNNFLELPSAFDVHEYQIIENFCLGLEDRATSQDLLRRIKGAGAFKRFKSAIFAFGIENDWYEFKRRQLEELAIEWLEENDIPFSRENHEDAAEAS